MRMTAAQLLQYVISHDRKERSETTLTAISQACCGVKELSGLSRIGRRISMLDPTDKTKTKYVESDPLTPADVLKGIIWNMWGGDPLKQDVRHNGRLFSCVHIFYNQALPQAKPTGTIEYGELFTAFILENKLGEVHRMDPKINPNSGNVVTTYIWTHDHEALMEWWKKNRD